MTNESANVVVMNPRMTPQAVGRWYADPRTTPEQRQALVDQLGQLTARAEQRASGRSLVSDELFDRLSRRIVNDEGYDRCLAERIVEQALVFLKTCAFNEGEALSPSALVDVGWHTFLLYTKDYAEFCQRIAGRFIHHVPDDLPGASERDSGSVVHTLEAIARAGYAVDSELWTHAGGKCGQCYEDGNCRASGADGNENTDTRGRA